jgi:outer membrane cobalamin receptor
MKKRLLIMLAATFFLIPVMCQAENNTAGQGTAVLDDVIVSATKTQASPKDISNAVIVVDQLDIQDSPALGLGDLLGGETGIDWRTYGNYGGAAEQIQIRGMGADGTQVLVNGVTINSPSLGTSDVSSIPTNNIDRVEVVKGSGSVLYGSGASAGIVNIITKSPRHDQTDLFVTAGYGSENTYQVCAENGMFVTDQFGYFITAAHYSTDSFRDNADAENNNASLKLVYEGSDQFNASLYGDLVAQESGSPGLAPPNGTQPFFVNGVQLYSSESASLLNRSETKDSHLVLKVDADALDWLTVRLQADYTDMESDNYSRYYDEWGTRDLIGNRTIVTNEVIGLEGNVELNPVDKATLLAGVQYKDYTWERVNNSLDGNGDVSSTDTTKNGLHSMGYFGEIHFRPTAFIKANAGIRYEDHSEFGSESLPRFGLIVNPSETTAIKANYGKHFKAPTPNDLFWPYQDYGFYSVQGNLNLKPETGRHIDVGIEQRLMNNKIVASLTYFEWDIEDKINWIFASGAYAPENLNKYEADGFEAGLKIMPYANTLLVLNYTKTDALEETAGGVVRQARYSPDDFFKARLTYTFNFGLDVTTIYRYTSDRPGRYATDTDLTPSETLNAYQTIDLKATQRFGKWAISCQVNNILDENYGTYVSSFKDYTTGTTSYEEYKGAGRSFYASVNYSF